MDNRANIIYNEVLKIIEDLLGNSTTYGDELQNLCLKLFGSKFRGVHASDKIPKMRNKQMAILNLDKSNEPGSHWVAIVKDGDDTIVYDSFGRDSKKIISSVFKSGNGKIIDTDYDAEQTAQELNCGPRSISFLLVHHLWGREISLLI